MKNTILTGLAALLVTACGEGTYTPPPTSGVGGEAGTGGEGGTHTGGAGGGWDTTTTTPTSCKEVECPDAFPMCSEGQCFWVDPDNRRCVVNEDCADLFDGILPICYGGYCTACDDTQNGSCAFDGLECAFGRCYDAINDPGNCGGSSKGCPGNAPVCRLGRCETLNCDNVVCTDNKPNCYDAQCFNAEKDPLNCGKLGNICPSAFPTCYLGDCVAASN